MDLIDKKISEKLKLFEYIDKKYGANIDSSEKAPPKKSDLNQIRNFPPNTYFQKETRSKKEIYDNIYSDFKTNSYMEYFQSPSINTFDSNKTKHDSKFKKNSKKNFRNVKIINNLSRDKDLNRTAENTIRTKSGFSGNNNNSKKNLRTLYPPNDSGNRLYNYGYYIKNKLNKKRQKEEEKMKRQMTPKILNRSKEMIKDKDRDPNKFEERLYYAEKNDTNDSIYNRRRTLSRENINYEKYNNTKFTYHPKINKKSLLIASKLEPSNLRITRKKASNSHILEEKNVLDYYSNLFKDKTYTYKKKVTNLSPSCGNEKSNELYMKGMQDMKRKEKTYNENLLKKKEEYKNYSYHPKISKTYSNNSGSKNKNNKKDKVKEDIYTKNKEWKKRLEKENSTKRKKYDELENKKYTFKPEINKLNMQNDVPFIMKNIQQMNEYVNKRRKILKKKKEEENYKKRKLGLNANNYNVKTTIPKEFDLKTEQRSKSNKKERDINMLNKNLKKKDEFYNQAIFLANKNNKIKNEGFSGLNLDGMEECKNNFWNDNNNNFYNKGMKFGCSMTQSQQDFLNAVNDLHITIDKLNI